MQISGTGHWFLEEGWIDDHSVEFLVDSGSSVTAMSDIFYRTLVHAGAPLGTLQYTARTLRSANGTGIEVLGCSYCTVSFLGLQTEFPIIICNLATGTDAIIGTDILGSVLPHTLDIKNGLLFAQDGASLQLHRKDSALSGRVFTVGHSSIPPYPRPGRGDVRRIGPTAVEHTEGGGTTSVPRATADVCPRASHGLRDATDCSPS